MSVSFPFFFSSFLRSSRDAKNSVKKKKRLKKATLPSVSPSVTRSPFLNSASIESFFSQPLISGPPPCTSTGRMPTQDRSTRSLMTPALSEASTIAAPPYLTTIVFPRKRWR